MLSEALPDGRSSPNQIPVVTMALAFFVTVLTGGRRFAHLELLRSDEIIRTILGVKRLPSAMTLTRYFGAFVHSQAEHLSAVLGEFTRTRLSSPALGEVLDLDSTVFERYGRQEGSLNGNNPSKHGRPPHHPILAILAILAMLAGAKLVLHSWLRSGNMGSARGVSAFLAETLERLTEEFRLYALQPTRGSSSTIFSSISSAAISPMRSPCACTSSCSMRSSASPTGNPSDTDWKSPRRATSHRPGSTHRALSSCVSRSASSPRPGAENSLLCRAIPFTPS